MKPPRPPDSLVDALGRHFFLGRSSAYLPERHGVLHGKDYRAALKSLPSDPAPDLRAARGRLLRLVGERDLAAAEFDAALAAEPGLAAARAWRWELRSAAGSTSNVDIERAVALEPENGWWRLWLALGKATLGVVDEALADSEAATALLPREALTHAVEGLLRFRLKRPREAVAFLDRALSLDPTMEWSWRLRGMCKFELGDRAGCLADSVAAMRLDENAGLLFVMLGLHKEKTDTRRSLEVSTRHIEKNPKDFWAYVFRADNRRSPEIGENQGALDDLLRAAELDPRHGWVWAYLSRCQVTLGDFRAAGESLSRAVALDPACGWIQAWRGEFLRRSGDAAGAEKTLDAAVRLFPDYELAYAWRGSARRLLGKPIEALEDLGIAIQLKPHTLDLCYFERMQTFRSLGRVGDALEDIQRASALNPKYVWETEPKRFGKALAELDAEIRRDPANALAHLWRGDVMMRMRDFPRAERDLTRALSQKRRLPEALILRGRTRCELKKWKPAFADFDAAVASAPDSPFAYAWRGRARMLKGDSKRAIADFELALEKEKNSAWILAWKGEAEFKLKRPAAAEASLTKALEIHARFADAFLWRGAVRLSRGDYEAAFADLTQALSLQPDNALALYYRGQLLIKTRRDDEARADFARAAAAPSLLSAAERKDIAAYLRDLRPTRARASFILRSDQARAMQREGRHEEAAGVYTELLARRKRDVGTYRLRAEAYRCMGRYDLGLRDLDTVVTLQPGSAEALSARVEFKRHLWDFKGGLQDAEAAIALDSKSPFGWVLRAECLRSLGRYAEAVASASKAIARDPKWSWAYVVRAKARRQKGELELALADTRQAETASAGADAYAHGWRAEILRKSGRLQESLREISLAATLQPTNAWFLALRGQIQVELGAREKGLADLQESMRLDPRCSCDYDFLGAQGPRVLRDEKLAWVYALRGGVHRAADGLAQARADLDRALRLAPGCFWILAWHGELLIRQGESAAGLAELRRALKLHARYPQAWVWLGQALIKEHRTEQALEAFTSALAIEPNNVWGLIGRAVCLENTGKADEASALFARAQAIAPALFSGPA
jgi:tetratricopeptide (TPR) repeat protein